MAVYAIETIANTLILLGRKENILFTKPRLMRLIYIAHGFMYAVHKTPLTNAEFLAFKEGPYCYSYGIKHDYNNGIPIKCELEFGFVPENTKEYEIILLVFETCKNLLFLDIKEFIFKILNYESLQENVIIPESLTKKAFSSQIL